MRIAIVGGGASGLVAAWLLSTRHEVHLYESASHPGGHVRTLGQNVPVSNMPAGKVAENGPLGFHVATSPTFVRLLKELRVPTKTDALGSNLFLRDNRHYSLRSDLQRGRRRFLERRTGGLRTGISLARFLLNTRCARAKRDGHKELGDVLPNLAYLRDWFRCMVMTGYSTPMELVDSLPASFAAATLRQCLLHSQWMFIPGGVYSYQAQLLSRFSGRVWLNSPVDKVFRDEFGVRLSVNGNTTPRYDKLIMATPPGRVLSMLDRPTEIEHRCFSRWGNDIRFRTIAHTDQSLYENSNSTCPTVADYFQRDGKNFAYNCCVSRHYTGTDEFHFAYNLDDLIEPAKRLDSHEHHIPAYSHAALAGREELINTNGASHTCYAGAWLGHGLHEGAVSSANQVALLLGGRSLTDAGQAVPIQIAANRPSQQPPDGAARPVAVSCPP